MPVLYVCDRCDKEAAGKAIIKLETVHGTSTNTSEYWLCVEHLRELHAATAKGGERAK